MGIRSSYCKGLSKSFHDEEERKELFIRRVQKLSLYNLDKVKQSCHMVDLVLKYTVVEFKMAAA